MKKILFALFTILSLIIIIFSLREGDKSIDTPVVEVDNEKEDNKEIDTLATEASSGKKDDVMKHALGTQTTKKKITPAPKEQKPFTRNTIETKNINSDEESPEKIEFLKKIHDTIFSDIEREIKKTPSCIENIKTKEEALACTKNLILLESAIPLSFGIESNHEMEYFFEKWDDSSKAKVLDELEAMSSRLKELKECMDSKKTKKEKGECLTKQDEDLLL